MGNSLISLLAICLLLFAGFSLATMNHEVGEGHGRCPLQAAAVVDCIQTQSFLDSAISHLKAVSKFFSTIPANNLVISFVLLMALFSALFINFKKEAETLSPQLLFLKNGFQNFFVPANKITSDHWFALHENSPAFITRR